MVRVRAPLRAGVLCVFVVGAFGCGRSPVWWADEEPSVGRCSEAFVPEGPVQSYDVELFLTADDAWEGFADGVAISGAPSARNWQEGDRLRWSMDSGCHAFAIQASDVAGVISGFIGTVSIDGARVSVTGDGSWVATGRDPGGGWEAIDYDDSSWEAPSVCGDQRPWGDFWPAAFLDEGATWIWHDPDCRSLGNAWFRFEFVLP